MDISKSIKNLRLSRKLTQAEFGKIAGVSGKAVSTWELGTAEPRMGALQKIADHFNLSKSSIIDGTWDDPAPSAPASPSLADHEEALLHVYRQLNDEGQEKVRGYTEDLAASSRYIKTSPHSLVEEK